MEITLIFTPVVIVHTPAIIGRCGSLIVHDEFFLPFFPVCTLWRIIQQLIIMAFPVPPRLAAFYRPRAMSRQLSVSMSLTNKGLLNPTGENNCFLNSTVQVSVRIELLLLTILLPFTAFLPHLISCPSLFPKTLPSLLLPPTCSSPLPRPLPFSPSSLPFFPPFLPTQHLPLFLYFSFLLSSLPFTSSSHLSLFSPSTSSLFSPSPLPLLPPSPLPLLPPSPLPLLPPSPLPLFLLFLFHLSCVQ